MGEGCVGLLQFGMVTEESGLPAESQRALLDGCVCTMGTLAHIYCPLQLLSFSMAYLPPPIYLFCQLSRLSPSSSNLSLPFNNTTNQKKRLFLHLSLTCWVLRSLYTKDLVSPCQPVLAG